MAPKAVKETAGSGHGNGKDDKPKVIIKKTKGHGGGHHGGAWKVAYADFVTAMMALFLVLWLLGASNSNQKAVVAQYFREPGVFTGSRGIIPHGGEDKLGQGIIQVPSLEVMHAQLKQGLAGIKDLGNITDQVPVEITADGLQIEIVDKNRLAFFDLNNASIKPVMQRVLELVSKQIKEAPNKIAIGGHTDARGYHNASFYSNWELSSARALNTRRALEDAGVGGERFVQVVGYADRKLRVADDPLAPENRRITILIMRIDRNTKKSTAPEAPGERSKDEPNDNRSGHPPAAKANRAEPEPATEHTQRELQRAEFSKSKQTKNDIK